MKKGYLVFENGRVFEGERFGAPENALGEAIFTTSMCGYLETLTDPSSLGQLVIQTFPLIGNYGVIDEDFEGPCSVGGYIVHQICDTPSNFRSQGTLDDYLRKNHVPGLCSVDTREIARMLRDSGPMNAAIVDEIPECLDAVKAYRLGQAVSQVGQFGDTLKALSEPRFHVTVLNCGVLASTLRALRSHGCDVTVVPWNTSAQEILSAHPDGVLLSNGPGDPAENIQCIEEVKQLLGKVPLFGIGLGHQLLALAAGGKTEKMALGHHGANHPVHDAVTGRTYITHQNHGYVVLKDSLPENAAVRYVNVNDGTCEGFELPDQKAFSVQFYPECCSGTSACLFERFADMMGE